MGERWTVTVESIDQAPDEHCGERTLFGYGLAGGAMGAWVACDSCGRLWKARDDDADAGGES